MAQPRPTRAGIQELLRRAMRWSIPQMAAALAFRTIFGIIPVTIVALVVLKFFTTDEDIRHLVSATLEYTGVSRIAVTEPPPTVESTWLPGAGGIPVFFPSEGDLAAADLGLPKPEATAASTAELEDFISQLVQRVGEIPFKTIGLIGLAALLYAAIGMLVEVERAFNQIYHAPVGRKWIRRVTQYWTILTLGSLFLFATFFVGEKVKAWLESMNALGQDGGRLVSITAAGYLATVIISTLLFLVAYTTVPNTRVKVRPALAGAFLAALIWEAGKWGFTQYLHYSASYARLYGSVALVPLFMLWVYVTWIIVLLGLQVTYFLQHRGSVRHDEVRHAPAIVDPASILALMGFLARRFESGAHATPTDAARALDIPHPIALTMLARLAESGLVHRLAPQGEQTAPAFALARAPDRIAADEVLRIGFDLARPGTDDGPPEEIARARVAAVAGKTLADFYPWHKPPTSEPTPQAPPEASPAGPSPRIAAPPAGTPA